MIKQEAFDENTRRYEKWFERNEFVYRSELEAVEELLPHKGKGIEIGVGTGRFSHPFSIKFGLDPSMNMLKIAKEKGIEVVKAIGEKIPFSDRSFDFVLIVTTICFFDEPFTALKESARILKDDGSIIIGFIDKESKVGKIYQKKKENNVFYREASFFDVKTVVDLLERSGFHDFSFAQTIFRNLDIGCIEKPQKGYGKGSFVVVKGKKN
ncbi:MAG: class I SAM-dependent methyltransferase [Thermoplasmatota archaeon]